MQTAFDWCIWFFSDLIFMHIWGWGVRPLYNWVTQVQAEIVAKVMLFVLETAFYLVIIILVVLLIDFLLSKRNHSREKRLEKNKKKIEENRKIRERYERKEKKNYREYDDAVEGEGDYKSYDDLDDY